MFWTILILVLLCAIGGLLWLHYSQQRSWQDELAMLEGTHTGQDEEEDLPETVIAAGWRQETAQEAEETETVETPEQEPCQAGEESGNEDEESEDEEDIFSKTAATLTSLINQFGGHAVIDAETETPEPSEQAVFREPAVESVIEEHQEHHTAAPTLPPRKSTVPDPYIEPFVDSEPSEYAPAKLVNSDLEVITLEEATRSLHEAAEEAVQKAAFFDPQPAVPSHRPSENLKTIDLDDPAVRRTRERVLASVSEISRQIPAAQSLRHEYTQAAMRAVELESLAPFQRPEHPDEIRADDIRANLSRHSAARRFSAAQILADDYRPQTIRNEEILANLSHSSSPLGRRAANPIRRIDTSRRESVLPETARVEQSAAKVQPKKPLFPPKTARPNPASATAPAATAPAASVKPQPEAHKKPPVFAAQPVNPTLNHAPINAHISNKPSWSIADRLISEASNVIIAEPPAIIPIPAPTQSVIPTEAERLAVEATPQQFQTASEPVSVPLHRTAHTPQAVARPSETVIRPVSRHQVETPPASASAHLPTVDLLLPPQFDPSATQTEETLLENSITIEEKLAEFKVKVKVMDAYAGPVITRYEIEPDVGVRGNAVLNLEKDLARSLGVASIRVVETIPGKTCMGLELPNPKRQMIRLSEIFNSPAFTESKSKLTLALGQDITGEPVVTDLAKAPHLLVAGTTGSGKSVGVNAMILSMLFKASPEDVRMIMIDPKMLELSIYEGIPHLLAPVVTDMKLAANALNWCVNEMEKRYRLMSHLGVRNLAGFNQAVAEAAAHGRKIANPFSFTPDDPEPLEKLPFIVVVVDEFADLMMTAGKKIEELIARLAQKARAAGIHLILATQRPSVDVITGLIKANIPTRIAFQVSSKVDSRTILDQMGAENLLGQGDMLFLPPGTGYPQRVHGAFASDGEVHRVVEYLKQFGEPDYIDEILSGGMTDDLPGLNRSGDGEIDPMYDEAVAYIVKSRKASISGIQRALRIGYNRAARLIDQMEADGIVSAPETNGNRTVLAQNSEHSD